eukprot:CAMPEP_0174928148 /NCGR_PEP_ID=MMETSP1355-20121228/22764_1 /TAXON_ID=464990 /ORGANISM="Hemiselmis tepida, Strain CCMP443" /LENGTH=97 /DNA_ID=CAMNT_0016174293 /DNA_START=25 /DNA_END=316 /DNA_ORIENTATION=+
MTESGAPRSSPPARTPPPEEDDEPAGAPVGDGKDGKYAAARVQDHVNVALAGGAHPQLRVINVTVGRGHRHPLYKVRLPQQPPPRGPGGGRGGRGVV